MEVLLAEQEAPRRLVLEYMMLQMIRAKTLRRRIRADKEVSINGRS